MSCDAGAQGTLLRCHGASSLDRPALAGGVHRPALSGRWPRDFGMTLAPVLSGMLLTCPEFRKSGLESARLGGTSTGRGRGDVGPRWSTREASGWKFAQGVGRSELPNETASAQRAWSCAAGRRCRGFTRHPDGVGHQSPHWATGAVDWASARTTRVPSSCAAHRVAGPSTCCRSGTRVGAAGTTFLWCGPTGTGRCMTREGLPERTRGRGKRSRGRVPPCRVLGSTGARRRSVP